MRMLKTASTVLALASIIMALPTSGKAADLTNKTVVAFTQPVEIPGMVLAAGAYVFKTSSVDKDVVQVYDGSESHLLTTLMTEPSYRLNADSKPVILEERPAGTPVAMRAWFANGEIAGHEFVTLDTNK